MHLLILKVYVFLGVISLRTGKMVPVLARAMETTKNFSIIFIQFVVPGKKSEDNFIATRKLTTCYNINNLYRIWKKYVIFIELRLFAHPKGK